MLVCSPNPGAFGWVKLREEIRGKEKGETPGDTSFFFFFETLAFFVHLDSISSCSL